MHVHAHPGPCCPGLQSHTWDYLGGLPFALGHTCLRCAWLDMGLWTHGTPPDDGGTLMYCSSGSMHAWSSPGPAPAVLCKINLLTKVVRSLVEPIKQKGVDFHTIKHWHAITSKGFLPENTGRTANGLMLQCFDCATHLMVGLMH